MESEVTGKVRDKRGSPIAGAVVSDGLSVRLTGADGRFQLPGWGPLLWVCPPKGFTCARWWRRRDHLGQGFVLSPAPESTSHRIAHITDLHLTLAEGSGPRLRESPLLPLAGSIRHSRAGLVLVTGDITDRGTIPELKAALRELSGIGVPFRLVPGNHDHYGHQDEPRSGDLPVLDRQLGSATFGRWEEIVGPRWWSMNFGDLHLVALDWFSARTDVDRRAQMSWLAADLSLLPPTQPVVLLSHEQLNDADLHALKASAPGIRLVAVLSGHRHAPRAIRLLDTLHLSTGPALAPGRDWSPPHMRLLSWERSELTSRTILPAGFAPPRFRSAPPRWSFQTRAARTASSLHLAGHPHGVVTTTADSDRATGTVGLLDARSGKLRWSWGCPQPVASAAAVDAADGAVFLQTAGGMVVRLDDGRLTWMIEASDPIATWVTGAPVLAGAGGLIIEGAGFIRGLNRSDGRVRWTRQIGDPDAHHLHPAGRLCDSRVLLPLPGYSGGLTALDPNDGTVLWCDGGGSPDPKSSPAPLSDGTALIVREGAVVERFELATGRVHWSTPLAGPASAADPVIIDELALVVTADAVIHILDSKTGWLLREHRLPRTVEPDTHRTGTQVASAVLAVGELLHLITVTGEWWRLDPFHWEPVLMATLPVAVTDRPVEANHNLLVPGREGIVLAASLKQEAAGKRYTETDLRSDRRLKSLKLPRG